MSSKESTVIFNDLKGDLHVVHGPLSEEEQKLLNEWTEADKKKCFQVNTVNTPKPPSAPFVVININIVSRDPHEWDAIL
jgi:hypothetical protein